jgi:hypothetical protein
VTRMGACGVISAGTRSDRRPVSYSDQTGGEFATVRDGRSYFLTSVDEAHRSNLPSSEWEPAPT